MSVRLYYNDAYSTDFEAKVIEKYPFNDATAVILDQTLFYPTSGGQPSDFGTLNQLPVRDVFIREDNAVVHVVDSPTFNFPSAEGKIEWSRRFDHMQQHTGQHILSQAFIKVCQAETVGFHLSGDSCTIDLDQSSISQDQLSAAQNLANQIVWENRPITVHFVSHSEADALPLRKRPQVSDDKVRLVDITDFDLNACGGTHVSATGSVGLIKIIRAEKRNQKVRVEFRCGGRALADYTHKNDVIGELSSFLTTGSSDLKPAVEKMQSELKAARKQLKKQQSQLLELEAEKLIQDASTQAGIKLIKKVFSETDLTELRNLAIQLTKEPGRVVFFGLSGSQSQLVFKRSNDLSSDMGLLLKEALPMIGSTKGGGSPILAQGGGQQANRQQVQSAIDYAEQKLLDYF